MIIKLKNEEIEFEDLPFKIWNLYDKVVTNFEDVRLRENEELECQFFFHTFNEYIDTNLWGYGPEDDFILYLLRNKENLTPTKLIEELRNEPNSENLKKQFIVFNKFFIDTRNDLRFDYCETHNGYCILQRTNICTYDDFEKLSFEVRGKIHSFYATYLLQEDNGDTWFLTININDFFEDYLLN